MACGKSQKFHKYYRVPVAERPKYHLAATTMQSYLDSLLTLQCIMSQKLLQNFATTLKWFFL